MRPLYSEVTVVNLPSSFIIVSSLYAFVYSTSLLDSVSRNGYYKLLLFFPVHLLLLNVVI